MSDTPEPTITLAAAFGPLRPGDCPRDAASCSGRMLAVGGGSIPSCGLSGCKHNHNPTHGGCGVDLRSTWEWAR